MLGSAAAQSWAAVKLPTDAGVTVLTSHDDMHELVVGVQSGRRFTVDLRTLEIKELSRPAPPMLTAWVELDGGASVIAGLHGIASDAPASSTP